MAVSYNYFYFKLLSNNSEKLLKKTFYTIHHLSCFVGYPCTSWFLLILSWVTGAKNIDLWTQNNCLFFRLKMNFRRIKKCVNNVSINCILGKFPLIYYWPFSTDLICKVFTFSRSCSDFKLLKTNIFVFFIVRGKLLFQVFLCWL